MSSRENRAKRLAETYTGGRYDTPWKMVEAYREYQEYMGRNPQASPYQASKALDQPRSRIRQWKQENSVPDPMRAIQVAETNGWLDLDWESDTTQALNCLIAWIFAGGSITRDNYAPYFAAESDAQVTALRQLIAVATDTRPRVNERDGGRTREVTVRDNQTILGRYLTVLGAPRGLKNDGRDDISLPEYLDDAQRQTREDFARTYIWLRGTDRPDRPTRPVQIREERPQSYVDELKAFFDALVDGGIGGDTETYTLTEQAANLLYHPPTIVDV